MQPSRTWPTAAGWLPPLPSSGAVEQGRRVKGRPCEVCPGCLALDCGSCSSWLDMAKFGGRGVKRRSCEQRACHEKVRRTTRKKGLIHPDGEPSLQASSVRIGAEKYQASLPQLHLPSFRKPAVPMGCLSSSCVRASVSSYCEEGLEGQQGTEGVVMATDPQCACCRPALWHRGRWFCSLESSEGGCGFEHFVPSTELTPLCHCHARTAWERRSERFVCVMPQSSGGCGFSRLPECMHHEAPELVPRLSLERERGRDTGALLTAAAYGLGDHCFVAPTDCGLGLFARSALQPGKVVCAVSR